MVVSRSLLPAGEVGILIDTSWEKALQCAQSALDKKAYDLVALKVSTLTPVADYFIVCTGRSDTQVRSICEAVREALSAQGIHPLAVEGFVNGQWVLIDFGDVVVHIFYEDVREFYNLDGLWAKASRCELPEPYSSQAQDLKLATA